MRKPGQNQGEANFKNKLNRKDVMEIFTNTERTQQELADHFGISQSTVNHIKKGRTWAWLTGARNSL